MVELKEKDVEVNDVDENEEVVEAELVLEDEDGNKTYVTEKETGMFKKGWNKVKATVKEHPIITAAGVAGVTAVVIGGVAKLFGGKNEYYDEDEMVIEIDDDGEGVEVEVVAE